MRTEADVVESMIREFGKIADTRVLGRTIYPLVEILITAFVGILCGADDWHGIAGIVEEHEKWFRKFLPMVNGVPSHDTYRRVFMLLKPEVVTLRMIEWIKMFRETCGDEIIAIDGKALRRSGSKKKGLKMLYTVGAWATENGLILGQQVVDDKSNEITAIPHLLRMLSIKGNTFTFDAAGCQKNIAQQIDEGGGFYVMAVKGNQESLEKALKAEFQKGVETNFADMKHECIEDEEIKHGRIEYRATHILELPKEFKQKEEWASLNTMVVTIRQWRNVGEEEAKERWDERIFMSNHKFRSKPLRVAPRRHWGVETSLHWVLDVQFREDDHQLQDRHGAANLALLRRLAVSVYRQDKKTKTGKGTKNKRLRAAANPNYALRVMAEAVF